MKIMSFNTQSCTNYITKEIDYEIMAEAIKTCQADIVGLNEIHEESHMENYSFQTRKVAEASDFPYYKFCHACTLEEGNFGNGFISKIPIVSAEVIGVPDPDLKTGDQLYETRALLKVKLENGYTILVIHFGLNHDEHLNAVKVVVENLESEKCILMGDFNVEPDNEVLNPIRAKMKDSAELYTENLLSFPSDKPHKRIDYIFASPDVEFISADIPAIVAADHRPAVAEIK